MAHYIFIPLQEFIDSHLGDDVGRTVDLISRARPHEPVLFLKPIEELGPRRGLQHTDHRGDDAAFLDEIDLPLEDGLGVAVEADNKAPMDLQSGTLDDSDILNKIPVLVLELMAFRKTAFIRGFDPDKHGIESGPDHHVQQLGVVRQIDGRFRVKDTPLFPLAPLDQRRQQFCF